MTFREGGGGDRDSEDFNFELNYLANSGPLLKAVGLRLIQGFIVNLLMWKPLVNSLVTVDLIIASMVRTYCISQKYTYSILYMSADTYSTYAIISRL
jgi:hypothetical protein